MAKNRAKKFVVEDAYDIYSGQIFINSPSPRVVKHFPRYVRRLSGICANLSCKYPESAGVINVFKAGPVGAAVARAVRWNDLAASGRRYLPIGGENCIKFPRQH